MSYHGDLEKGVWLKYWRFMAGRTISDQIRFYVFLTENCTTRPSDCITTVAYITI